MATTFNRDAPMAGLPPMHVLESDYTPTIEDKLKQEEALLTIKTTFEANLKKNVSLTRVSCPLFVTKRSGFNDNLNGIERPATFAPRDFQDIKLEVPFSLAKWKRWATVSGYSCSLPVVSLLVSLWFLVRITSFLTLFRPYLVPPKFSTTTKSSPGTES